MTSQTAELQTCNAKKHGLIIRSDDCPYCKIEALEKRLGGINSLACYASEEDTDSQPTMLLKIGRVARGEEEVTWPII